MKNIYIILIFIVISLASCTPAPALGDALPTKPVTPSALPVTVQTEKWKKYQTELARVLLAGFSPKFGFPLYYYKSGLCEWDVLGRVGQLEYVWAFCGVPDGGERDVPAVIYLNESGYAQKAEAPSPNAYWRDDLPKLSFPADVQTKFDIYTSVPSTRLRELIDHAHYRYTHPDEAPLIISTAPVP